MKVILLQEIKGQGGEGDVVEVKRGYAVNYLFPQKFAIEATKGNLKQLELRKHNIAKREAERLDSADKIQAALADKTLTIPARVGEEGQLFGSVTTLQIAEKLKEELGLEVDRKKIDVHGAIKTAGEHSVTVSIYRDIKAVLTVNVVDENEGAEEEAVAVAVAGDIVEAEELDQEAEALGLADKINETIDAVEAEAKVEEIVAEADEAMKNIADTLAAAADELSDENPEAAAEAAAEVLSETEAVVDAAAVEAVESALEDEQAEQ